MYRIASVTCSWLIWAYGLAVAGSTAVAVLSCWLQQDTAFGPFRRPAFHISNHLLALTLLPGTGAMPHSLGAVRWLAAQLLEVSNFRFGF